MRAGYPCLSVHGGKDQLDRDDAIASFKNKVRTLMVATSVVGRGMDVQECVCVINYSCPNHLEEYVHRVGRTGRAGRTGTAYTFITPEEEQYAPLLVKALTQSQQEVPKLLEEMADEFRKKIDTGSAKWATSGYGGTGYNYFDPSEKSAAQKQLDMQRRQYEVDQGLRDSLHSEDEQEDYDQEDYDGDAKEAAQATAHAAAQASSSSSSSSVVLHGAAETPLARAQRYAAQVANTHTFLFYFIFVKVMLLFDMCTMVEIYVSPFQNFFFFGLLHH
jgi:ATP-dependent RNA helicase DDX46/PRP5